MSLPRHLLEVLDPPRRGRPAPRPWQPVWPLVLPGTRSPVVELHEDAQPPKLYGPYRNHVPR